MWALCQVFPQYGGIPSNGCRGNNLWTHCLQQQLQLAMMVRVHMVIIWSVQERYTVIRNEDTLAHGVLAPRVC